MKSRFVLIISIAFAVTVSHFAFADTSSHSAMTDSCQTGRSITLHGILSVRHEYGPPGWGEDPVHDSSWSMVVLKISASQAEMIRRIAPSCFDTTSDLTEVQLWSEKGAGALSKYSGTNVNLTGTLTTATGAPAEIQDAQLSVSSISGIE